MQTLVEFIDGPFTYRAPPPGGSIMNGEPTTNCDADLFLAAIATLVKDRWTNPKAAIELLHRKISQVELQTHYGKAHDVAIIERMNAWIRELDQ